MNKLNLYFEGSNFSSDFFKNHVKHNESSYEECDYVVSSNFEFGLDNRKIIQKLLDNYIKYDRKVIVFLVSDFGNRLNIPKNVILFRTSLYKSIRKDNEFILPYIWEYYKEDFNPINKTQKPIIGFCGNIKNNSGYRLSCINRLNKEDNIKTNFITRQTFGGGNLNKNELAKDFKNNILDSHFTLSNRGRGNFSIRFYQVLSIGRIPLLIDSDMIFPFEEEINWDQLIIKAKTETELIKKIHNWWDSKDNEELTKIQYDCKQTYENYLSPKAFGNKIFDFLITNKQLCPKINRKNYFNLFKFPNLIYKIKKKLIYSK